MRKQFRAGPHITDSMISEVLRYSDGHPTDDALRREAEDELTSGKDRALVQSRKGGSFRSVQNQKIKVAHLAAYKDTFEKVRLKKLTPNSAAVWLHKQLTATGSDGWVPSIRTLNAWFAEYCKA